MAPDPPSPLLFFVATAVVLAMLLAHARRTYGARLAASLVGVVLTVAVWKEVAVEAIPYEVLLTAFRPLGIPLGIVVGWLVTALLSLEFARRVASFLPAGWSGRSGPRVVAVALFTAAVSHAIEPIGQIAGWWRWHAWFSTDFPVLASGAWAVNVLLMTIPALLLAPRMERAPTALHAAGMLVAVAVVFTLASEVLVGMGPLMPRRAKVVLFVLLPIAAFIVPGVRLAHELDGTPRPFAAFDTAPWVAAGIIAATLIHYAHRTGHPEFVSYVMPLVGLTLVVPAIETMRWWWNARVAPPAPASTR